MARMRTIKPGFFLNEALADLQPLARILFTGLWCIADRAGRLEDRPRTIKVQTLPFDDCDVDALLDDLAIAGFITRYTVGGKRFIQVDNFAKHQCPNIKEPPSTIPEPDESLPVTSRNVKTSGGYDASTVQAQCSDDTSTSLIGTVTVTVTETGGEQAHASVQDDLTPLLSPMEQALTEVCQLPEVLSPKKHSERKAVANVLARQNRTSEQVREFGRLWASQDWRGKRGNPPTPEQVQDEWNKLMVANPTPVKRGPIAVPPGLSPQQSKEYILNEYRRQQAS